MVTSAVLDASADLPLYQQLSNVLRSRIETGMYKPGDVIPSERVVAQQHGITRQTVRHALRELVQRGYLEARQGKGYIVVASAVTSEPAPVCPLLNDPAHHNVCHDSTQLLKLTVIEPSETTSLLLKEKLIYIEQRLLAQDVIIGLSQLQLSYALCAKILQFDLVNMSVERVLVERCAIHHYSQQHWIEAVYATKEECVHLGLPEAHPMLVMHHFAYQKNQRLMGYRRLAYRGDWHQCLHET